MRWRIGWVSASIEAFFIWRVGFYYHADRPCDDYLRQSAVLREGRELFDRGLAWCVAIRGGMIGITFLALLLTQVDKLLLSKLLTLSEYGYYTLAATVAAALYMLISPITQAWYASASYAREKGLADRDLSSKRQTRQRDR